MLFILLTQPFDESRLFWLPDTPSPSPPRVMDYRGNSVLSSSNSVPPRASPTENKENSAPPASAIVDSALLGAPPTPLPAEKCRRRRQRNAHRAANRNSAPRSAAPVTPDDRWANRNSATSSATQHHPEASDPAQMTSTSVYNRRTFHSQISPQPPGSTANENLGFDLGSGAVWKRRPI